MTSSIGLAHLLLNAVQQRPVGLVGGGEGHHGQQLGLLTDDTLLGGKSNWCKAIHNLFSTKKETQTW